LRGAPGFVHITGGAPGQYQILVSAPADQTGIFPFSVEALDQYGASTKDTLIITVSDRQARAILVNFSNEGLTAPAPWNNWTGPRAAGDLLQHLQDDNQASTQISLTMLDDWSAINDLGMITGDNTGIFPDAVLADGLADSS